MTEDQLYFWIAVTSAVAAPALIVSLIWGRNPGQKKLRLTLFLLGGMVLLRFGGNYLLSKLDMGWRCTPRYTMSFFIWVLMIVSVFKCVQAFEFPQKNLPIPRLAWMCSILSLFTSACLVTLLMFCLYLDRLHEHIPTVNGQPVIHELKVNGGVVTRFYLPVNSLVHGKELEYDWHTNLVQLPNGEWTEPHNS